MEVSTLGPAVADDAQGASVPWAAAPDRAAEAPLFAANSGDPDLSAEWSKVREGLETVARATG